jgi:hypothetical protein
MKCCASPTTSTAAEPLPAPVVQTVEALLFSEVLKPLAAGLGPLGEEFTAIVAERTFVRPST